jgi:ATP-dependent Clp protease protease subunit
MNTPWKMQAENKQASIAIGGVIGDSWDGVTAESFNNDLSALGDINDITLSIYSGGGSVIEGNAIFMALATHPAKVHADITFAASMATQIAMAADTVSMAENGWFMIHNPTSFAHGEAAEMRKTADLLDGMKAQAVATYQRHAKLSDEEIGGMMDSETWMNAETAKDFGFIQEITEAVPAAASVQTFENAPDAAKVFMVAEMPEKAKAPTDEAEAKADELKAKATADAKAAYDEGETAGLAKAAEIAEKLSADAVAKAAEAEQKATAAQAEAKANADALKKAESQIDSITAGFEYNTDATVNASVHVNKHPYFDELRKLKAEGMSQVEASAKLDKEQPNLRLAMIAQANQK